jgi:hypothetical protein
VREMRREGLGLVWGAPGVIGVAFIGPGGGKDSLTPLRLGLKGIKGGNDEGGGKELTASEARSGRHGERRRGGFPTGVGWRGGEDGTDTWGPCVSGG